MKRLNDEISFHGKIEHITMMDLRSRPGEVMTAVSYGKVFIIERNGHALAMLSKPPGAELTTIVDGEGKISYGIPK